MNLGVSEGKANFSVHGRAAQALDRPAWLKRSEPTVQRRSGYFSLRMRKATQRCYSWLPASLSLLTVTGLVLLWDLPGSTCLSPALGVLSSPCFAPQHALWGWSH